MQRCHRREGFGKGVGSSRLIFKGRRSRRNLICVDLEPGAPVHATSGRIVEAEELRAAHTHSATAVRPSRLL